MARTLTYQQLLDNIKSLGIFQAFTADQTVSVNISGTITINLAPYQQAVLKLDFKDFTDESFTLANSITSAASDPPIEELFGIDKRKTNIYQPDANGGSIIHNADRIIINAKDDFAMMFGKKGVVIASPGRVNIDAGKSITLFSRESGSGGVFFGLPNRGEAIKDNREQKQLGTTKGDPTPDFLYEPIVLGIKLANLLDDIIFAVQNADMASAISEAKWQPSTIAEMELLRNRIPEMLSTYAYIDGISHEQIDTKQLETLIKAQKKYKKSIPPKELAASVAGEISPSFDSLGLGGGVPIGGPIGQNTVGGGSNGAILTESDKAFAAKYNGGVMPVKINADGTIPVTKYYPGEGKPVEGKFYPDSKPDPCGGKGRPCSRTFYERNDSYVNAMPAVQFYTQSGKLKSTKVHPHFAAKLGPALAEIKSVGGDQYIHDLTGGIIARNVTGGTRLSHHSWGLAIDINTGGGKYGGLLTGTTAADWGWNTRWDIINQTVNGKAWNEAHRGFYEKVGAIMMKHGIGWYYAKDPMHFSIYEGTPTS